MRSTSLFLSALLCALLALTACDDGGADADADASDTVSLPPGDPAAGAALYNDLPGTNIDCVQCHGDSGTGDGPLAALMNPDGTPVYDPPPADLTMTTMTDAEIAATITMGKGDMPPVEGLTDQQLADLVAYVNQLRGQ